MSQTNAQLLADSLGTASTGTIPIGGIILWSGSVGSIPDGWKLCDGNNSTPDLRNRFVVGTGNNYAVGSTGGADTVSLTTAQMPQHDHLVYGQDNDAVATGNASDEVANVTNRNSSNAFFNRTTSLAGSGSAHENRPPYYALAYIMRTS
tara:strand:- start:4803 stop:5249 length:447 start_codon:yes stop_codon:yes gene_type:complete